jgi:AcrR family transcriptional regulator
MTLITSLGAQATRIRCLQGTAQAIAHKGIDATTVQDILEAAGLSRRTFYQNFSSKDEALYALFEILTDAMLEAVRAAATSEDPIERALQGANAYLTLWQTDPKMSLLLQTESRRAGSPLAPLRRRMLDTMCAESVEVYARATGRTVDHLVFRSLYLALEGLLSYAGEVSDVSYERILGVFESLVRRQISHEGEALRAVPPAQAK